MTVRAAYRLLPWNTALLVLTLAPCSALAQGSGDEKKSQESVQITETGKRLNVNFENTDVRQALKSLFKAAGVNFVIDQSAQGTVTLSLKETTFREALDATLKAKGLKTPLACSVDSGVYTVTRASSPDQAGIGPTSNNSGPSGRGFGGFNGFGANNGGAPDGQYQQNPDGSWTYRWSRQWGDGQNGGFSGGFSGGWSGGFSTGGSWRGGSGFSRSWRGGASGGSSTRGSDQQSGQGSMFRSQQNSRSSSQRGSQSNSRQNSQSSSKKSGSSGGR